MAKRHTIALGSVQFGHDLTPQHARMHDIGLFYRGQAAITLARQIHANPANTFNFGGGIGVCIKAFLDTVAQILDTAGLGKIRPAAQFAQDHDIKT